MSKSKKKDVKEKKVSKAAKAASKAASKAAKALKPLKPKKASKADKHSKDIHSKNTKRIWLTGAYGFVGSELAKRLEKEGYEVIGTGRELSVTEPERLEAFAVEVQPDIVINAAGIPRDAASLSNRIKAYETNALGAKNVALAANAVGADIIQISTDDVYASLLPEPVNEFDNPHPNTPYGKSKRAGEVMVRDITPDNAVIRSSWLYSKDGGQLKAVLDAAREGRKYEARTDQFGSPTSISLYSHVLNKIIEKGSHGTFHIASKGKASRYDFAKAALWLAGYDPKSILVPTKDKKTAEDIVLESLILEMYGAKIPEWQDDLAKYMQAEGLTA